MNAGERKTWHAIYKALHEIGDVGIRAGLARITDEQAVIVVRAALGTRTADRSWYDPTPPDVEPF